MRRIGKAASASGYSTRLEELLGAGVLGLAMTSRGGPDSTTTPPSMNVRRRHLAGEADLVGHHHHGHAVPGQVLHHVEDIADQFRVERGRGLIKQHELRVHGQGPGNRHTLLLAAGELGRVVVGPVGEPHPSSSARARAGPLPWTGP